MIAIISMFVYGVSQLAPNWTKGASLNLGATTVIDIDIIIIITIIIIIIISIIINSIIIITIVIILYSLFYYWNCNDHLYLWLDRCKEEDWV